MTAGKIAGDECQKGSQAQYCIREKGHPGVNTVPGCSRSCRGISGTAFKMLRGERGGGTHSSDPIKILWHALSGEFVNHRPPGLNVFVFFGNLPRRHHHLDPYHMGCRLGQAFKFFMRLSDGSVRESDVERFVLGLLIGRYK